ncbi:ABC transporter substrate-binding protein [Kibdelosporangium aridum]|uniref:NitT/TauT family transport system substrate-binding protein n=1 Tax=Kibdelosporangium aridum TaxID=2030 RepID=A0A1W2EY37_KIBAR|nr:ABC transporter substrate-binding protein [Kibdelosporangium aridum]SMD14617.1 NitT/TauT family transport system substrate-binding protein [Kibdelosporangium aridum]
MRQSPRMHRLAFAAAILTLMTGLSGCGLLDGSSGDPSPAPIGKMEKTKVKVGVFSIVDVAPLYLAIENGYFKAEGLDVEPITAAGGPDVVTKLVAGELDFGISSYPAFFGAQAKQVASFKLVSDAYQACDGHSRVMVKQDSPITQATDLVGKKVAVSGRGTISDLAASSVLGTFGVDPTKLQWIEIRFPDMEPSVQNGNVDAAVFGEPFVTQAEQNKGIRAIFDIASGPTNEIALSGWGALDTFVKTNPRTVAAFQRAMARAVDDTQDRPRLEQIFTGKLKITPMVASLVTICRYPKTLEARRIQRPADLMAEFGLLPKRHPVVPGERLAELDVAGMLLPPPPPAPWVTTSK